jgi:hypothetical protein
MTSFSQKWHISRWWNLSKNVTYFIADNIYFWERELKESYNMSTSFFLLHTSLTPELKWADVYLLHWEKEEQDICNEGVADGGGRAGATYDDGTVNVALFQSFYARSYQWMKICCGCTVPKILFKFSQKWNYAVSFPIPTFTYLQAIYIFPESVCLFGCSKIGRLILGIYKSSQIHECGNWGTEDYNFFLEIEYRIFLFPSTNFYNIRG